MKNFFSLLLILTSFFYTQLFFAQVNTDLRPTIKSPEVNKFEQYLNMPVNLVSGTPQVSIPIYTLEYGGMSLPISLEYDAGGVKVESIASSVGQNWSLNMGGVVSRIVKGGPDEGNSLGAFRKSQLPATGFYLNNGLSNIEGALNAIPYQVFTTPNSNDVNNRLSAFNNWISDLANRYSDAEPDLFYFSTPEGGAKFVFNDHREVVYLENTDFIIKEIFLGSGFTSWNATSPNGIKYSFGYNNINEQSFLSPPGTLGLIYRTDSWFLNEISNYTTNDKILLEYTDNNYSTLNNNPPIKKSNTCAPNLFSFPVPQCSAGETYIDSEYDTFAYSSLTNSCLENKILSKLVNKVIAGNTEINFIYSTRNDLAPHFNNSSTSIITAKKLDEVQIIQSGVCIKKFKFNYSTTISNDNILASGASGQPNVNTLKTRLILNSFVETSCDGLISKPYIFSYNSQPLPNKVSFAQDKWGFYNGKTNNKSLVPAYKLLQDPNYFADRSTNILYSKAGSLEKITYPTGGTVNFEYELNKSDTVVDFKYDIANPLGTLFSGLSSTQSTTGIVSSVFTYTANVNESLLLKADIFYNPTNGPGCSSSIDRAVSIMDNVTGTVIAQINYQGLTSSKTVSIPVNKDLLVDQRQYTVTVQGYGGSNGLNFMCNINTASLLRIPVIPIYDVGGLRVKSITHKTDINNTAKVINYSYFNSKMASNPKPYYKINYNFLDIYNNLEYNFANSIISPFNCQYFFNFINLNNSKFLYGSYYSMSSGTDFLDVNFIGPQISYGQVIETDGSNGRTEHNFNPYKSYLELNTYVQPTRIPADPKFQSLMAGLENSQIQYDQNNIIKKSKQFVYNYNSNYTVTNYPVVGLGVSQSELGFIYYPYILQGQTKTLKTETDTAKLSGQDVTTSTDYEYGTLHNQPIKTTTTNSKGELLISKMYYPNELNTEPNMAELITPQNRRSTPIKIETYKNTTAVADKLSEQKTVYAKDATTGNLLLPQSIYAAKFPNVLPFLTTPNVGSLERKVTSDKYDTNGTLLQFTPENGVPVSIIWGYNKTQPIAKIENATYASIPQATITNLQSLSDADTDNCTLSTCKEQLLRNSLNALRSSLPATTQVTTYTYNPLVGVTSITDPKGLISYFEYDQINRLKFARDKDLNIIQRYCYNYKGQPETCNDLSSTTIVTYLNTVKSGAYTRNNCAVGTTGSSVTYTVAAGVYASTISQVDADTKAQTDVNINGQAYANTNGTCITPTTYYSIEKSGTFTRNNCAVGTTGSSVTYTVAAGSYTSVISQADADAKAQTDVNNNGQTYANSNGTCSSGQVTFTYDYDYDPSSEYINIHVYASSGNHNGATINFKINHLLGGLLRRKNVSVVLYEGETTKSAPFPLVTDEVLEVILVSTVLN